MRLPASRVAAAAWRQEESADPLLPLSDALVEDILMAAGNTFVIPILPEVENESPPWKDSDWATGLSPFNVAARDGDDEAADDDEEDEEEDEELDDEDFDDDDFDDEDFDDEDFDDEDFDDDDFDDDDFDDDDFDDDDDEEEEEEEEIGDS